MIIVGERINTSRKLIAPAVTEKNESFIKEEALKQREAGAAFIDVNCGTMIDSEAADLEWLVRTVQTATNNAPCSLDSPNPVALERALRIHQGTALVNSITAEKERFAALKPLVRDYRAKVIALTIADDCMPETLPERVRIAEYLINNLTKDGVAFEDIFIDPLVRPVSTGDNYGETVLQTITELNRVFPGIHTICGLSNISYGLPARKALNRAFLVLAIGAGLDAAIIDPLDRGLISLIYASELLKAKDEYAGNYIAAFREGKLEV